MSKIISFAIILIALCGSSPAQKRVTVGGGADIVSSYIWRGTYNAGASFQPKIEARLAGVALGGWGSVDFVGQQHKEVDLYLNYTIKGFTFGLTDYWWEGEGRFNYFHYSKGSTAHRWEANLAYQLPVEKFPLLISWNTMFAGNDYNPNGHQSYSTYIELLYPFTVGKIIDMTAFVGATPWHSPSILPSDHQGFSVCNVGVSAQYSIKCSEKFAIPIFSRLIFNPATEDVHMVFGLSLYFGS